MYYEPSSVINNCREFRSQYLRKSVKAWLKKLRNRAIERQAMPISMN